MNGNPLEFLTHRKIIDLGKLQLEMLEDLECDYNDSQTKLLDTIDKFPLTKEQKDLLISIIIQGCIFTPSKMSNLRKRILDKANTSSRELTDEFKKYKVIL